MGPGGKRCAAKRKTWPERALQAARTNKSGILQGKEETRAGCAFRGVDSAGSAIYPGGSETPRRAQAVPLVGRVLSGAPDGDRAGCIFRSVEGLLAAGKKKAG